MNDQVVKLILETLGTDGVKGLKDALGGVNTEGEKAADTLTKVGEKARDALGRFVPGEAVNAVEKLVEESYELLEVEYKLLNEDKLVAEEQRRTTEHYNERAAAYRRLIAEQERIGSQRVNEHADIYRQAEANEAAARSLEKVDAAAKKAGSGVAGFGQSALNAGRFVQDFTQGGIPGILNNIEGLTAALGLGSGLAGVFTIAGVAAYVFKDQLMEVFRDLTFAPKPFQTAVEELAKKLKDLKDQPYHLSVDVSNIEMAQRKLDDLKKSLAEFEAQRTMQKAIEVESGKKIQDVLRESPLGAGGVESVVVEGLRRQALEAAGPQFAAIEARRAAAQADLDKAKRHMEFDPTEASTFEAISAERKIARAKEERSALETQITESTRLQYVEPLRGAKEGTGAVQTEQRRRFQDLLVAANMPALAEQIGQVSPEMIARTRELTSIGAGAEPGARAELARAKAEQAAQAKSDAESFAIAAADNLRRQKDQEKADAEAFAVSAAANIKKVEAEKKRIEHTVGTPWQRQFEVAMATNAENITAGMGGVNPVRFSQQLQNEMVAELKRRHATGGAALGAARSIAAKGEEDLGKRAAEANLSIAGQTLTISRQLISEYARMNTTQQQLVAEAKSQQQAIKASSRNRLVR